MLKFLNFAWVSKIEGGKSNPSCNWILPLRVHQNPPSRLKYLAILVSSCLLDWSHFDIKTVFRSSTLTLEKRLIVASTAFIWCFTLIKMPLFTSLSDPPLNKTDVLTHYVNSNHPSYLVNHYKKRMQPVKKILYSQNGGYTAVLVGRLFARVECWQKFTWCYPFPPL